MTARIYQRPQSAMTSGRALIDRWIMEYDPAEAKLPDPLTGWAGSGDTRQQLTLRFPSCEAAKDYAARNAIDYVVVPTPSKTLKIQAYADNFR